MISNPITKKQYTLSFERKPQYLLAKIEGKSDTLEIAYSYWAEIVEMTEMVKPTCLLVWENFPDALSTQDTFVLVNKLCQLTQFLSLRIAVLDEHLDQLDRNKLGGMMASNRGFTCCIFTTYAEAEKWLLHGGKTC